MTLVIPISRQNDAASRAQVEERASSWNLKVFTMLICKNKRVLWMFLMYIPALLGLPLGLGLPGDQGNPAK